jgi:hypothetical protein
MKSDNADRAANGLPTRFGLQEILGDAVSELRRSVAHLVNDLAAAAQTQLLTTNATITQALRPLADALPEMTRRQFLAFAAHGWYPDIGMPFSVLAEIATRFETDDPSGGALCARHFEDELPHIEAELLKEWPTRAPAIAEAFAAHRLGMFYTSIPVFFAQADGICREGLGRRAFARLTVSRTSDRVWDMVLEAIQLPMAMETPLNQVESRRGSRLAELNRHAVMHGDPPLEYGTRENSLRAASFLNYVAAVVRLVEGSSPH